MTWPLQCVEFDLLSLDALMLLTLPTTPIIPPLPLALTHSLPVLLSSLSEGATSCYLAVKRAAATKSGRRNKAGGRDGGRVRERERGREGAL